MQNAECKMQNWDMIDGLHRSFYVVIARTTRSEATWWDVAILRHFVVLAMTAYVRASKRPHPIQHSAFHL